MQFSCASSCLDVSDRLRSDERAGLRFPSRGLVKIQPLGVQVFFQRCFFIFIFYYYLMREPAFSQNRRGWGGGCSAHQTGECGLKRGVLIQYKVSASSGIISAAAAVKSFRATRGLKVMSMVLFCHMHSKFVSLILF